MDKIGHFSSLVDMTGAHPGVLWPKSGILLIFLFKHSRSPVIHVLKKMKVHKRCHTHGAEQKEFLLVEPDVTYLRWWSSLSRLTQTLCIYHYH